MEEGNDVWVQDEKEAWVIGVVDSKTVGRDGSMKLQVKLSGEEEAREFTAPPEAGGETASELEQIKPKNEEFMDELTDGRGGVDDLIDLTHLHEPAILHVLSLRFFRDVIYTYTGPILLAVNPFQRLPLYTKQLLQQYYSSGLLSSQGVKVDPLPPHVYATADAAYRSMRNADPASRTVDNRNQSLLVSGESGAGKTVTTKIIMQYLATVGRPNMSVTHHAAPPPPHAHTRKRTKSTVEELAGVEETKDGGAAGTPTAPSDAAVKSGFSVGADLGAAEPVAAGEQASVEQRVLQSNPILEAFGNAKTLRNENSSRFGKFIELDFNNRGQLVGAQIETYLLEKIRLVFQAKGERNYHVFYQIVAGANEEEKKLWRVQPLESYHYLNQSGCTTLLDVSDADELQVTRRAMNVMGVAKESQDAIFQALAGLLHLGNIEFVEDGEGSKVSDSCGGAVSAAADLLGMPEEDVRTALTSKKIYIGSEVTTTLLSATMAANARDGLAKNIYSKMFDWVVSQINENIKAAAPHATFIGVLDIFGFEHFEHNSFEQLCINYANETLQQQFNDFVFKLEQAEYTREEIEWSAIDFEDNKDVLELIEGTRPPGLLKLVDEQCLAKGTDEGLARKYYKNLEEHARFTVSPKQRANFQFVVRHYAGLVEYSTEGFCEKNQDQLHQEAHDLVSASSCIALSRSAAFHEESRAAKQAAASGAAAGAGAGGASRAKKKSQLMSETVGSQFKSQLHQLLTVIKATTPHYVRCLKANPQSVPRVLDRVGIVGQLRCGGVLEAVRVARLGYPVRLPHTQFVNQYRCLLDADAIDRVENDDPRKLCKAMAEELKLQEGIYQIGLTKVFFKKGAYGELEGRRTKKWRAAAVQIQARIRCILARKRWLLYCNAMLSIQNRFRFVRYRKNRASAKLQRFLRLQTARIRNKARREAVIKLQSHYRRQRATREVEELRIYTRASHLQAILKMLPLRRRFVDLRVKSVAVQSHIRMWLAKRKLKKLRKEAREVGNLKEQNIQLRAEVMALQAENQEWKNRYDELAAKFDAGAPPSSSAEPRELPSETSPASESDARAGDESKTATDAASSPMFPQPQMRASEGAELKAALSAERQRVKKLQDEIEILRSTANAAKQAAAAAGVVASASPSGAPGAGGPTVAPVSTAVDFAARREHQIEATLRKEQETLRKRMQRAEKQAGVAAASRLKAEHLAKEAQVKAAKFEGDNRKLEAALAKIRGEYKDYQESHTKAYANQISSLSEKMLEHEQELNRLRTFNRDVSARLEESEKVNKLLEVKIREQKDTIEALETSRASDSDVKMALAQRLENALVISAEHAEEVKTLRFEVLELRAKVARHAEDVPAGASATPP